MNVGENMNSLIEKVNDVLEHKEIVCVSDLVLSKSSKLEKEINEELLLEIKNFFKYNKRYEIEEIGKPSDMKLYIKHSKSNINKIVSVGSAISKLNTYKSELDSNRIGGFSNKFKDDKISKYFVNTINEINIINDLNNHKYDENFDVKFNEILNLDKSILYKFLQSKQLGLSTMSETKYNNLFLRGQSRIEFKLNSKVFRMENHFKNEEKMYHELMSRNPHNFDNARTHLDILQQMQHYGLPTRILDVSTNILTALYFACSQDKDYDGEIIVFAPDNKYVKDFNSDTVEILSTISFLKHNDKKNLQKALLDYKKTGDRSTFNKQNSIKKITHEIRKMVGSFDCDIDPDDLIKEFFVVPARRNERIIKQDGAFIISGLGYEIASYRYDKIQENNLKHNSKHRLKHNKLHQYFVIPAYAKERIIDELNLMGVNSSTLFPEIEHVSDYITSKYT